MKPIRGSIGGLREEGRNKAGQGDSGSGCDQCVVSGGVFLVMDIRTVLSPAGTRKCLIWDGSYLQCL